MASMREISHRGVPEHKGSPMTIFGKRISLGVFMLSWLLVLALGAAGYFYYELKWASKVEKEKEIADLTGTIGEFIELPSNETPTLATVTDREKLADQTFFLNAENGDKVLIYSGSGKAILYRPSSKKVIDMTTVNINTPAPETEVANQAAPIIVRLALRNGSKEAGATNAVETKLKAILPTMAVTSQEDAEKSDYTETMVVDLTGANAENTQKIADELGGKAGSLPEGETAPTDADILVIIGSSAKSAE